jgi:hypothetical protein
MEHNLDTFLQKAREDVAGIPEEMLDTYAAMLDNQGKELHRIAESTTTANIDKITSVFLPAIKKLARDSILSKIVGVQPIPDRVAIVQYIDYVYTNAGAVGGDAIAAGDSAIDKVSTNYSNDPGEGETISNSIDFVLREKGVTARQRKLAGRWTFEAQDSSSKVGVNLDQEITKALAAKIVDEVNFEFINDLYSIATGATGITWTAPQPADAALTKDRIEKELYYNVVDVAASIFDKTRRYPNFVICNPRIASFFKRTGEYIAQGGPGSLNLRRLFVQGTLNDEFALYVVPNLSTNNILVGYKGNSELETGAIYAPYIPLVVMDSFFNTEKWTWVRSVGSFYAKSMVMSDLYGVVQVTL